MIVGKKKEIDTNIINIGIIIAKVKIMLPGDPRQKLVFVYWLHFIFAVSDFI